MITFKNLQRHLDKMDREQLLKFIGLAWNEKGIRDIVEYYTIGALTDDGSAYDKEEIARFIQLSKIARNY